MVIPFRFQRITGVNTLRFAGLFNLPIPLRRRWPLGYCAFGIGVSTITRLQREGDKAYFTRVTFRLYVEDADDAANKVIQRKRIGITWKYSASLPICKGCHIL